MGESENIVVYLFRLMDADRVQSGSAAVQHSHVQATDQFAGSSGRRSQLLFGASSELQTNVKNGI